MKRYLLLITGTMIWGFGFVATRWTFNDFSPNWSNCLRYIFAGIISIPVLFWRKPKVFHKGPFLASVILMIGMHLQTLGIQLTTLAKSGFFTTFYCLFTPFLSLIFLKTRIKSSYWPLLFFSLLGSFFMCEMNLGTLNRGDAMIILCAFFFTLHILVVDRFASEFHALDFNLIQCFYMGIFALLYGPIIEPWPDVGVLLNKDQLSMQSSLFGFMILSIFSSHVAFSIQVEAQKGLPPHIVSLIFLSEGPFAAFFGFLFFQEKLSGIALVGCLIIFLSMGFIPVLTNMKKRNQVKNLLAEQSNKRESSD